MPLTCAEKCKCGRDVAGVSEPHGSSPDSYSRMGRFGPGRCFPLPADFF
jgi:hypothetical protein